MLVFLNPSAAGGTSGARWQALRPELERGVLRGGYELVTERAEMEARLAASSRGGVLVAAGGDGTVNLAVNALMRLPGTTRQRWVLGAIGLGSSNDFHRRTGAPARPGLLARLDAAHARPRPVGQVDFVDEHGAARRSHFVVNASVGIVARGNHLFNECDAVLRRLKPRAPGVAIWYAALRALVGARALPVRLALDGAVRSVRLTNLHVLLSPFVSGGLRYDLAVEAEHAFGVAWCEDLGLPARARTLVALARGRFSRLPWAHAATAREVRIGVDRPTPLETDGEVRLARDIRFTHRPGGLNVCAA